MITDAYHDEKEALFDPGASLGERGSICDTAIATFSHEILNAVLEKYPHEEIAGINSVNGYRPAYLLDVNSRRVIFYMSLIGSCPAGTHIIELQWQTGFKRLIMFGSAGALDSKAVKGKFVIPTHAYRDEGLSYHYAPPSDYLTIKNGGALADIFRELGLPYVCGRVWTTDGIYRETRTAVEKRRSEGCIAVEMELAGVQAVCDYHGIELYDFLVTGDVLDGEVYDYGELDAANHSVDKFSVALKLLEKLDGRA